MIFSRVLMPPEARAAYLPSNLCLRKSKRAFCIMSVTWVGGHATDWGASRGEAASLGLALEPAPSTHRADEGRTPPPTVPAAFPWQAG